jgi:hypothetical protein
MQLAAELDASGELVASELSSMTPGDGTAVFAGHFFNECCLAFDAAMRHSTCTTEAWTVLGIYDARAQARMGDADRIAHQPPVAKRVTTTSGVVTDRIKLRLFDANRAEE